MEKQFVIYAVLTVCLWGLWGFFGKLAVANGMPPISVFVAEILISLVVVASVIVYAEDRRASLGPWNIYGIISGGALSGGLLCYYLLLQKEKASIVIPLTASYPLVATMLAVFILGERLRPIQWIGVLLTVLGLVMLVSSTFQKSK